ncbi:cytochrome subunit of sulfide dehydrogenase [Gallionellaceae bacterium]|nr:cytochrome subunit of sulfide dehydrogenase [Gallionellaceae bacterium]
MKLKMAVTAVAGLLIAFSMTTYASGNAAEGKTKAAQCATCHGAEGNGGGPNPPVVNLDAARFTAAMNDYKSGKRNHPIMTMLAKKLSDQDVADLAAYYAGLKK